MGDEQPAVDRNDPELKYLTVEKNQLYDPTTQAEWTQKRLVWVPHESQVIQLIQNIHERRLHLRKYHSRIPCYVWWW